MSRAPTCNEVQAFLDFAPLWWRDSFQTTVPPNFVSLGMLAETTTFAVTTLSQAGFAARMSDHLIPPVVTLILCIVAGIGTLFLLPNRNREASITRIGGVVLVLAGLVLVGLLARTAAGHVGLGVYFWIFAALAVFASARVVTHPKPVYSALYFVLTVFASAGLFVLLWAEFMAAALVLIYAGAILVTYVFVIMLAAGSVGGSNPNRALSEVADYDRHSREPIIASIVGFGIMGVLLFVIFDKTSANIAPMPGEPPAIGGYLPVGDTQRLGVYLFRNHLVNLEVAGLILTLGMIGAIVIARRGVVGAGDPKVTEARAILNAPATPIDDSPQSIPVYGTDNPRQKAYPQT